ncbi:MAG: LuxR C-terminal-related transcriptional regulator [Actinomycetes bacterium]
MGLYLEQVSEFISYLGNKNHTIDEILAHMVLCVLRPLDATSIFLFELSPEGTVESVARSGASALARHAYPDSYDLRDATPINDCIKSHKSVWITTLPKWPQEYVFLNSIPYTDPEKSWICFPIVKAGTPVAAIGIFCMPELSPSAELDSFLRAVGSVFSLHVYNQETINTASGSTEPMGKHSPSPNAILKLNERQWIILKLMSEGRTNSGISELLGYSESTIRQETIKIYAYLQCTGREEASIIYQQHEAEKTGN